MGEYSGKQAPNLTSVPGSHSKDSEPESLIDFFPAADWPWNDEWTQLVSPIHELNTLLKLLNDPLITGNYKSFGYIKKNF